MIRLEHNVETGEVIEIELTAKEVKDIEKLQAEAATAQAKADAAKAKADADKAALLARLGLTEDELKIILG
jgi:hypothetical protein